MKQARDLSFGPFRSYVWPIHSYELRKFLPMLIMLFCVCFNYTTLRNLKDAIVVTESGSGAAVIPFIKVWVMFPAAVLTTIIFTKLSNRFSRQRVFQIIVSFFLVFFFLFAFFIYPNREALHPHDFADFLEGVLPVGFKAVIGMLRHWTLTCFYVICELWGSIVLSVLFWSFANEVTKISEAPRFYSALGIFSNAAAIVAGQVSVLCTTETLNPRMFFGNTAWEQTLMQLLTLIVISGVLMLLSFQWMNKNVLSKETPEPSNATIKKKKEKLGFLESLRYIGRSKYLLAIAAITISYNLVICLVEVIWKDQLRELYPVAQHYNIYINNLSSAMGVISTTASLLMVGILSKLGWTKTALLTPLVLLVTSVAFFICLLADNSLSPLVSTLLGTTPLALAVLLGSIQNCFSKAAKYSLFDTTREMSFIPLSPEHKLKGKAAIDGIGGRLGKSGGSIIHQGFYLIFFSLSAATPYIAVVLLAVIAVWVIAVLSLGKQFEQAYKTNSEIVEEVENEPSTTVSTPLVNATALT